jgi:ribosomal protein S12 methylthiotransferase accessory factor
VSSPIVFLGPSLPVAEARGFLAADYRPPIRRGDLESLSEGQVVGIIDGVFDQNLSVSPTEIRNAIARGVRVAGSSSMGALRAAEVREMEGFGRIHRMYREGAIEDDDEVALVFDPDTGRPLSEPMVNIRYAVERLARPGTIEAETARRILTAAKRLHYRDRNYRRILIEAGLSQRSDADALINLLRMYDLKREDAISLLEKLPHLTPGKKRSDIEETSSFGPGTQDHHSRFKLPESFDAEAPLYLWEYGERVPFRTLILFLKMTGRFPALARRALLRLHLEGQEPDAPLEGGPDPDAYARQLVLRLRAQWGWLTAEEARVTMGDLGFGSVDGGTGVEQEVRIQLTSMALARASPEAFLRALRSELFMADLELKRALIRCGSLDLFASRARRDGKPLPSAEEVRSAQGRLCAALDVRDWGVAVRELAWWGVSAAEAEPFVTDYALARRVAGAVLRDLEAGAHCGPPSTRPRLPRSTLGLSHRKKVRGSGRFCVAPTRALALASRLKAVVGITRVANITGLDIVGLPNALAYRPEGRWSSTIGSGKSETLSGARVGAIMEEVEKWAQEQFPRVGFAPPEVAASYRELRRRQRAANPELLGLPHDSCYRPELVLGWRKCADLMGGGDIYVPSALIAFERTKNDILYSERLGSRVFNTNGVASGFTLEEAVTHALCEYIERHACTLAYVLEGNPGGPFALPTRLIDLATVPRSTGRIVRRLERVGRVRLFDVTSDVQVPTFGVKLLVSASLELDWFGSSLAEVPGWAAHPDPEVAANMALLEASQSLMTQIAGGREDLTVHARSLGRHERTHGWTRGHHIETHGEETPTKPFDAVKGFRSRDAGEDVAWILDRLRQAGIRQVLVADYSLPEIAPARVVRVLIPGLESNGTFFTGTRARARMLEDLLPRPEGHR